MTCDEIVNVASLWCYELASETFNPHKLCFRAFNKHGGVQIDIWPTTMTVATTLNHPRSGPTTLYRRGVKTWPQLIALFRNPRVHGMKSYALTKRV